ncbi:hypothetical protein ES703_15289 [subsurface metagenome]
MKSAELEKYKARVKIWYFRFVRLSNQNDELQAEIERQRKIVDRNASEIIEIIQELEKIREQSEKMEFSNISLEK